MAVWVTFTNRITGWTIALSPNEMAKRGIADNVTRPADIESREEFERLIAELHECADEVWPRGVGGDV